MWHQPQTGQLLTRTCRIGDFALQLSRNRIMILGRTCMPVIQHTGMACLCRFMLSCLKLLHESSWSEYFKFACIISCDKNTNSNWLYTSSSHVSVVCTTGHCQPGQDSCPVDPGIRRGRRGGWLGGWIWWLDGAWWGSDFDREQPGKQYYVQ